MTKHSTEAGSYAAQLKEERKRLGLTQTQYGALRGVHFLTVSSWERGATLPQRRYSHNQSFFSRKILTPVSCYWAGFLAADGGIDPVNTCVAVSLAEKDRGHLELLRSDLSFTGPIGSNSTAARLQIYSAHQLIADLARVFKVVPRKSLILEPPLLKNAQLIKAYILGYIDGDGSARITLRDELWLLDVLSGSLTFIRWAREQLERLYSLPHKKIYSFENRHLYRLEGRFALPVLQDLKRICDRRLDRKWGSVPDGIPGVFDYRSRSDKKKVRLIEFIEHNRHAPRMACADERELARALLRYSFSDGPSYDPEFFGTFYSRLIEIGTRKVRSSVHERLRIDSERLISK